MRMGVRGAIGVATVVIIPALWPALATAAPATGGAPSPGPAPVTAPSQSSEPAPTPITSPPAPATATPPEDAAPEPASAPNTAPPVTATEVIGPLAGFHWEPFGYLRLQYIAVQSDPNVAYIGHDDGFELQNARVGVRGRLGSYAAFVLSIDGAVDERTQANSPQGNLAVGLRDAYSDIELGRGVTVRAGYFQPYVDPQALVPDTSRELVDLPIESRGVEATEGYQTPSLPPGRSLGVALRLDPGVVKEGIRVGFEAAAQNGAGEFSSNNDNNSLALSASVFARFAHDGWLLASGRYNPRTVGDLPFRQNETDLQGTVGAHGLIGPVELEGGLIVERTTFETTGGPDQNAYGGHVQAMLRLPVAVPFAIGYRFGILDPSSLVTTDRVEEHSAGAVLGIPRLRMRIQLQLTHVVEQAARELSNDRIQLAGELAL